MAKWLICSVLDLSPVRRYNQCVILREAKPLRRRRATKNLWQVNVCELKMLREELSMTFKAQKGSLDERVLPVSANF